jgi:hypothetical protein
MSLINDALKRARDASCGAPPPKWPATPLYRPYSVAGVASAGHRGALVLTALVIIAVIAGTVGLAYRLSRPIRGLNRALALEPAEAAVESQRLSSQPVAPALPQATAEPAPGSGTASAAVSEEELVAKVLERMKTAAAATQPEPPPLVLQGITVAKAGREAMINGYSVREGDEIDGARVVAIESRRVRLQFGEREIVLRLP